LDSHILKSSPKKLIIVKTGNTQNLQLIEIFNKNLDLIIQFLQESNLVEINPHFIAGRKK